MTLSDLGELVEIGLLQEVQDALCCSLGLPMLFVSRDCRPITTPSPGQSYCWQLSHQGQASNECAGCSRKDRVSLEGPVASECPIGLEDIAIPILSDGSLLGYLITAQVESEPNGKDRNELPERLVHAWPALAAIAKMVSQIATSARSSRLAAVKDPLTGLATRSYFWECMASELKIAESHNYPVTLLLVDLDDFARINDTFGHDTGDRVLQAVGQTLAREIRSSDLAARSGSDCFVVMLRYTDPSGGETAAWRLKNKIASCRITARGQKVPVSASISHVTFPVCAARTPDDMFKEALIALRGSDGASSFYDGLEDAA